ncbi:MAG: sugar phosphate nucleotidyltransferase, partial [Gemmatimonadota bacterium]
MDHAIILAGGVGERFWPASTRERPKQLLPLISDRSMLRETADRLDDLVPPEGRWVFTSRSLTTAVAAECPEIAPERIVGEPEARNTAPAIGLAAGLLA